MAEGIHTLQARAAGNTAGVACNADLRAMWDRAAEWWAGHLRHDKNRRLQVFPIALKLLGDVRGLRILDAGCGEGSFARLLAEGGAAVTGVDFSRLLDVAAEEEGRQPRGIRYVKSGLEELPVALPAAERFDAAACNLVLHCVPDPDTVLRSLHARLKPGGVLVLADFHPDTFTVFSRAWTACVPVGGIEYRYTLSLDCPELTLFLHPLAALVASCERCGFEAPEILAPAAPSSAAGDSALSQFVYLRLRSNAHE